MFQYRLSQPDQESYLLLLDQFYKFKQHVYKRVDDLEQQIKSILENLWIVQPEFKQLSRIEDIVKQSMNSSKFDIDELILLATQVIHINKNQLDNIDLKKEHLHLFCAQMKFKSSQYLFDGLISGIQDSFNEKQQIVKSKETSVIWKYTLVHIDKSSFHQIQLFNQNYVHVETLIPLQHLILVSVYQSFLFNGNNNTYGKINSQKQAASFTLRVHEGYDTSACIYKEVFEINHNWFSPQSIINSCYKLQLNQSVYLKKGVVYSISMTNETKQDVSTMVHNIKGPTSNCVKFLGKETEHMCLPCSFGTIKQSLVNSSMPGFEVIQIQ